MTEEESEYSSGDSCSGYYPHLEMAEPSSDMLAEQLKKVATDHEARLVANSSRVRKKAAPSGGKGKGVGDNSGTIGANELVIAPVSKATPGRGKVSRTPATYDVEKLARWKPPTDVDEGVKAELGKLPKLPTPQECPSFGVLGTGPKFARYVVAPYMTFTGDKLKLRAESTSDNFEAMLEASTEVLARLSFASQAVMEREAAMERSAAEKDLEMERMRIDMQKLEAERVQLAVQMYSRGRDEGELCGWEQAVYYFVEYGHVTQAIADSVPCPFTSSEDGGDGGDERMETDGDLGPAGGVITGNETV